MTDTRKPSPRTSVRNARNLLMDSIETYARSTRNGSPFFSGVYRRIVNRRLTAYTRALRKAVR